MYFSSGSDFSDQEDGPWGRNSPHRRIKQLEKENNFGNDDKDDDKLEDDVDWIMQQIENETNTFQNDPVEYKQHESIGIAVTDYDNHLDSSGITEAGEADVAQHESGAGHQIPEITISAQALLQEEDTPSNVEEASLVTLDTELTDVTDITDEKVFNYNINAVAAVNVWKKNTTEKDMKNDLLPTFTSTAVQCEEELDGNKMGYGGSSFRPDQSAPENWTFVPVSGSSVLLGHFQQKETEARVRVLVDLDSEDTADTGDKEEGEEKQLGWCSCYILSRLGLQTEVPKD